MNSKIENEIIGFIVEELGVGKNEITLDSDIMRDFGVDGDDGYEFIMQFNKKFNLKSKLQADEYFNPEYFSIKAIFKKNKMLKVCDLINIVSIEREVKGAVN